MHSESGSMKQPCVPALHLALFLTLVAATVTVFWAPVRAAAVLALDDYRYEDIMVAPILCAVLLYMDRKEFLSKARFAPGIGIPILSLTVLLSLLLTRS